MEIVTIDNKKTSKILRKKTADFDFAKFSKADLRKLLKDMRETMRQAQGIGLSATQVGLDLNFFVAEMDRKFYSIFNPQIEKVSEEKSPMEEGCLSIPGVYGEVKRPGKVTLTGFDANGKKIKIKAWGLLARIFQHEVDHLGGKLFTDHCKELYTYQPKSAK